MPNAWCKSRASEVTQASKKNHILELFEPYRKPTLVVESSRLRCSGKLV